MEAPTGGRTGGVYIPPFKLAMMLKGQQEASKTATEESQKLSWEALRKSINGLINKVNVGNIKHIVPELFQLNLIRGRGIFARAIMKAQLASPGFTHIYASLIAVINTKLPENGELILKRVIYGFKRAFKRRDKITSTGLAKFIAHLVNHQLADELLALQLLTVLLEDPTDDSVEIAVNFVKEVGQLLEELSPQGIHAIFERFRGVLHEGDIDKRVQYTIEGLFAVRKSGFKDYPAIPDELDLVESEDQITFEIGLDDEIDKEEMLDVFRFDPKIEENEQLWLQIKKEILGDDDDEDEEEEEEEEEGGDGGMMEANNQVAVVQADAPTELSEADLVNLRRTVYLTIMSAVSFEECCHKLLKLKIPDGYESEL
jgi:pre-mRNA-splicing factor CWC22